MNTTATKAIPWRAAMHMFMTTIIMITTMDMTTTIGPMTNRCC